MSKRDGGTAFPMQDGNAIHAYALAASHGVKDHEERETAYIHARGEAVKGMSLRDYFAAKAMHALIEGALASDADFPHRENVAGRAYAYADAMLSARNQKQDPAP
ncbi:hypothetical protein R4370_004497 [Pseudomonas putida]|uniref:hypothetical protein n=1 Tax=Pseudomonas sp. HD6515 TaxID=2856556 RepID=UPI00217CEFC3|nr:hypothetical protein [Pseudomonas sp. HD6515]